jgi:predicted Zn finger-like uncharacterized protein
MIIECPGCQETYEVDMPSMAPEGVEIHCKKCSRSFLIRPHGAPTSADKPQASDPPSPLPITPDTAAPSVPQEDPREEIGFDPAVFLQTDEIPYSIVQAFDSIVESQPLPPPEAPGEGWHPEAEGEAGDHEQAELFLDMNGVGDTDQREGLEGEGYFSTPYPLGQDLVVGRKRKSPRLRLWIGGGLVAFVLVVVALLAGKCSGQAAWQRTKQLGQGMLSLLPFNRLESGKIQISDLNGYFHDRARKGSPVFVIEGKVTNHYKNPCHSIQVKGSLFDERGNRSVEGVVYCGNLLTAEQIRSYSREKIEKILQNAYGDSLSNFNVEPGKSVPFMLIFFDPPDKLSEFSLEVHQFTLQEPGKT